MGQEFASLTSWLLSANCRVAVRPQMYRREFRVLYELIFVAFDWFRILLHDHLLILTLITLDIIYTIACLQLHKISRHKNSSLERTTAALVNNGMFVLKENNCRTQIKIR